MPPVLSVVDYDAWKKGYMPPSEHILIDQLAYRGARVVMSMDWGKHGAVWLVVRDLKLSREARKALLEALHMALEENEPASSLTETAAGPEPQATGESSSPGATDSHGGAPAA